MIHIVKQTYLDVLFEVKLGELCEVAITINIL